MKTNKLKYIFTVAAAAAALVWGCDSVDRKCSSDTGDGGGEDAAQILFRGGSESSGPTRAADDFPNKTIGVTATYTDSDDWRVYTDINNALATVSSETGGVYGFAWQSQKYWPLDGTPLMFAAYSPHTSASNAISLAADMVHLRIELQDDMPDVMYADGNRLMKGYSKTDGTADLGMFKHAMSQLTVNVAGDDTFNESITIESLIVRTSRGIGILDLLAGDTDNLTYIVAPDHEYTLVGSTTSFSKADPFTSTVYLFPGTHEQTEIEITLRDNTFTFSGTYILSQVPRDDDQSRALTLERAANTEVNLLISSTTVQDPDEDITLQGQLSDWIPMGDLEVTIN